jgi:hypothetical protein
LNVFFIGDAITAVAPRRVIAVLIEGMIDEI